MSNLNTYVASVRTDLADPNPPAAIWSDADLQRHVLHAVAEYTLWNPRQMQETGYSLTAGSRSIDLTALMPTIFELLAVEYPTGQWPPTYVQFQLFGATLTLSLDGPPVATDPLAVNLYALEAHSVTTSASTIPPQHDEVIVAGAVHFAAEEYATKTAGQVNVAGPNTWPRYRDIAIDAGERFQSYLQTVKSKVTPNRLYHPEEPRQSRFTVEAPWRGG